ncbi:acyltransferase [Clostridiales bacterium PH28_bin88]|nr:acyltransferase [Clostridiales bacterium PH28_bin88]
MAKMVNVGLIQAANVCSGEEDLQVIKDAMLEKHVGLIESAAQKGAQVVCLQELFNGPYYACEQNKKWYGYAESIPDGQTTRLLQSLAKKHSMVIIGPITEVSIPGVYYNTAVVIDADGSYLGKYRKVHIPQMYPGAWEKFYFTPGNLGYPVFKTAYAKVGVVICHDRHYPEPARILGLAGAEIIFTPSGTTSGITEHLWELEMRALAVQNGFFVGAINRVGIEEPWKTGEYYGKSYVSDPLGKIIGQADRGVDEALVVPVDLDRITEVRQIWQLYRDRRAETYGPVVELQPFQEF